MPRHDVLIVEDDAPLRNALCETLKANEITVCSAASGQEALSMLDKSDIGLVLSDIQMEPMSGRELLSNIRQRHPRLPALLMTAYGTIEQAVDAMRDGASDYLVKPIDVDALVGTISRYLDKGSNPDEPIAEDPKSLELLALARRVAGSDATVTISGDSGCGKEVIARYIHKQSPRRDRPFVAINCAAIPENMLEAVLFGHEKGAFTGASAAHPGKFEQAQDGTLLLDEISEMDIGLQAKLLRVIQEKEVERIGGRKTIALDVRVLATTNRDLRGCVENGRFREDLYYRLNVFPLRIVPLKYRTGDILPLAVSAIDRYRANSGQPPGLTADAEAKLLAHDWPGNVRELENLIQRTLILLQGDSIEEDDLIFESTPAGHVTENDQDISISACNPDTPTNLQGNLRDREQQVIFDALTRSGGNRSSAAKILGISPRTLRYKLARLREDGILFPATARSSV